MKLSGNTVLITGGGSGIGLGMAAEFLHRGNTVMICGRSKDKLQAAASRMPGLITYTADISEETGRIALYNQIMQDHPQTNVLVNNAGIQNWMDIDDVDFYKKAVAEVETNVLAPIHLNQLFLQSPALNTILNVTSGLAFTPLAKVPVYCATKAFFHSYTESLRYLLKPKNIEVIEVVPPALNTDLGGKGIHDAYPPVSAFISAIFTQLEAGSNQLTFGFSEVMIKAGPNELKESFAKMNP